MVRRIALSLIGLIVLSVASPWATAQTAPAGQPSRLTPINQQGDSSTTSRQSTPPATTRFRSDSASRPGTAATSSGQPGRTTSNPSTPQLLPNPQVRQAPVPNGFPLSVEDQARVDKILKYWEYYTAKITTHQCKFVRYNYDFVFGSKEHPKTVDVGTVRYSAPDKGLMRVDQVYDVDPAAEDEAKRYQKKEVQFGEYWVCDGTSIFQFDSRQKTLTETKLPSEMQGKSISDGPLPFLFGAKADKMKERYWIREVTPAENPKGQYFLEAIPRRQEDAANFDRILVELAVDGDYLFPSSMKVFNKQGHVLYRFKEHEPNDAAHRIAGWFNSFVSPRAPRGWTTIVEDWSGNRLDQAAQPDGTKQR